MADSSLSWCDGFVCYVSSIGICVEHNVLHVIPTDYLCGASGTGGARDVHKNILLVLLLLLHQQLSVSTLFDRQPSTAIDSDRQRSTAINSSRQRSTAVDSSRQRSTAVDSDRQQSTAIDTLSWRSTECTKTQDGLT